MSTYVAPASKAPSNTPADEPRVDGVQDDVEAVLLGDLGHRCGIGGIDAAALNRPGPAVVPIDDALRAPGS